MIAKGIRFPRSMLASPANERLLVFLGVEIVEETADLEQAARDWLAGCDKTDDASPATRHVVAALERSERRAA